jgi:hypothetical protein
MDVSGTLTSARRKIMKTVLFTAAIALATLAVTPTSAKTANPAVELIQGSPASRMLILEAGSYQEEKRLLTTLTAAGWRVRGKAKVPADVWNGNNILCTVKSSIMGGGQVVYDGTCYTPHPGETLILRNSTINLGAVGPMIETLYAKANIARRAANIN